MGSDHTQSARIESPADRAVMDLGKDGFAHGMAYVVLSRVKSLEGVCVIGLTRTHFKRMILQSMQTTNVCHIVL